MWERLFLEEIPTCIIYSWKAARDEIRAVVHYFHDVRRDANMKLFGRIFEILYLQEIEI